MKNITKIITKIPLHLKVATALVLLSFGLILLNRGGILFPGSLNLAGLNLHFYGLLILSGVMAVTYFVELIAKQQGILPTKFNTWDQMSLLLVVGIVGARLFHVISDWHLYQSNLGKILAVWDGGLSIFGAIVLGGAALAVISYRNRLNFIAMLGIIAAFMPLGQIVGRFGNFLNQELYGLPTDLPWGIYIEPAKRVSAYLTEVYFHPVFWYEQILSLILLLVLSYFLYKYISKNTYSRSFHGLGLFGIYLVGYGFIRFLTEQVRLDPNWLAGLSFGEVLALISIGGGILILVTTIYLQRHGEN